MTHSLLSLFPLQYPELPLRAIKYQPNITLSFVLLNEDSAEGGYVRSWDIQEAIEGRSTGPEGRPDAESEHIQPHLEPLRDIFNFTIESQVLYHAPLSFEPTFGEMPPASDQSEDQKRLDAALEDASRGKGEAEQVAKELLEQAKGSQGWQVDEEMMKVFVNTERWSLGRWSSLRLRVKDH